MNKLLLVLFLALAATVGILATMQKNQATASNRALAEEQIAKFKLSPAMFQLRCGDAPSRLRDGRGFVLSYPQQNVSVAFLADPKDADRYMRVDYWSMKPLVAITLPEVVDRLGCRPR
jgi:hypothetical protein